MSYYACTNCWRILREEKTLFECAVCKDASRSKANSTKKRVASLYYLGRNLFGTPLRCRNKHHDLRLFCGGTGCGVRLPANNRLDNIDTNKLAIRIVGAQGAGKSVYLAMMYHEFTHMADFNLIGLSDTDVHCGAMIQTLTVQRERPEPLSVGERERYRYAWKVIRGGEQFAARYPLIMAHDTTSETWQDLTSNTCSPEFRRFLRHTGDIIFMVDGASLLLDLGVGLIDDAKDQWDDRQLGNVGTPHAPTSGGDIPIAHTPSTGTPTILHGDHGHTDNMILNSIHNYLASVATIQRIRLVIVINKADLLAIALANFPSLEQSQQNDKTQQYFRELLIKSGRALLVNPGLRFRSGTPIFAVSSLGFCPNSSMTHKNGGKVLLNEAPTPKGVTAPILWLLQNV